MACETCYKLSQQDGIWYWDWCSSISVEWHFWKRCSTCSIWSVTKKVADVKACRNSWHGRSLWIDCIIDYRQLWIANYSVGILSISRSFVKSWWKQLMINRHACVNNWWIVYFKEKSKLLLSKFAILDPEMFKVIQHNTSRQNHFTISYRSYVWSRWSRACKWVKTCGR